MEGQTTDEGLAYFADAADPIEVVLQVRVFSVEFGPVAVPKGSRDLSFEIDGKAITEMRFEAERMAERNGALELRKFDPAKAVIFMKR